MSSDESGGLETALTTIKKMVTRMSAALAEKALVAYYVAIDPATPVKARLALGGALVYLGVPVDVIPDYIPGAGLADDASVLATALVAVAVNVRSRHLRAARRTLRGWGFDPSEPDEGPEGADATR